MNRALFLDRDGVINEDHGYVHKIQDFHLRPGITTICRAAQASRMKIIVVTNQAGIGRGLYSTDQFFSLNQHMLSVMDGQGVHVDGIYFCPFHPTHGIGHYRSISYDRKPSPGMLIKACNDFNINPFASLLIGDKITDQLAAERVGIRRFVNSSAKDWVENALTSVRMLS